MSTQHVNKNHFASVLIVSGGISLLFSLLSALFVFAGIGILSMIIGGIIYIKNIKTKQSGGNISGIVVLLVSIAILSSSCSPLRVPMAPNIGIIRIDEKLPVEAGLMITEETKNYTFKGRPESITAGVRTHEFPLGEALEDASYQAFSQVFQKVTLVRTFNEAKKSVIIIEPKIEDFHFRYDQLSYVGFGIAVLSKIKVRVTLANGETKIWEKSIESPEQKKGPWMVNMNYEKDTGESASDALVYTLRMIALEIAKDASIRHSLVIPKEKKPEEIVTVQKQLAVVRPNYATTNFISQWALIIGISKYQYSGQKGLTNLTFADDDAKAFRHALINLGWSDSHIKLLANEEATQRNITIALESWLTKAGPNDQIVLFWAGHGYPDPEDPEKVYLACYDTDINIPATGYRMSRVRFVLEERKAKNVIVFADTCHAGKLITRGDRGISIIPNIEKLRREKKVPKGWIFMVGADTDRQAIEHSSWSNGAFTHSLIKGLSGEADGFQSAGVKDGAVTMGELKDYMNTEMPNETEKVLGVAKRPVITTSSGDPDIWNLTIQPE